MAINTYRLWMATDANRLLANQFAFIQAATPSFYQGNVAELELHIVATSGVGTIPVEVPFPAGAEITVAVGDTNTYPTGGSWELSVDSVETTPMPWNATTAQVQDALNALASVSAAGGVTVSKTGDGYTITWNTYGAKPDIGIGSDTLTPSSYESISLVQSGNAERRQIVFVELRQNPIALSSTWTALPAPSITVSEVQAWNGTNRIWRVNISPQPKAGTMTLSYGTKTATVTYNASASTIASALSPAQVFSTGQYQWDIALAEDSALSAVGSLIGYNGYSGNITFATSECHQFLAGAESKPTMLEVSMSIDDKRYTLVQTPCTIFADVVSDGVIQPLPLGVAMSEQVANVRFVRRDVDQNPDDSTQNQIWENLGVQTALGNDVADAISGSNSPSGANPFATISDLSDSEAVWGQITGTLSNQTDLQNALNAKSPIESPTFTGTVTIPSGALISGYLTQSSASSIYATKADPIFSGNISISGTIPGTETSSLIFNQNISFNQFVNYPSASWFSLFSVQPTDLGSVNADVNVSWGHRATWFKGYEGSFKTLEIEPQGIYFDGISNNNRLHFSSDSLIFTKKITGTSVGGKAGINIGIGGASTDATTPGDLWITTGGTSLNFRDASGAWRQLLSTSSAGQITTTSTAPVLQITQNGTGRSFVVQDGSSTPDTDCFIIDNSGNLGVGVSNGASPWVASHKVEVNGAIKANTITFDGTAQFKVNSVSSHSSGANTHDLYLSYGGSTYRIPMIFVSTP